MPDRSPGWLLRLCMAELSRCKRGQEDLRPYQRDKLIPFLLEHPRSAAWVDMGLGKTVAILTVLDYLFLRDRVEKALIIAPKRVAIQTWPTEMREWRHTNWITHSLIRSDPDAPEVTSAMKQARKDDDFSPKWAANQARAKVIEQQRRDKAMSSAMVHIIDRDHVTWLVDFFGKKWPYDCVIVDESTNFSDHKTKRWQSLAKVSRRLKRIHLLSGTPAPEGIQDLFAQVYLLDAGERFGRSITHFRTTYMMQVPYVPNKWKAQMGAMEVIAKKTADICIVMKEEDHLDVKKPTLIERPIVLERDELQRYKRFERESVLELDDDVYIEAVNSGVLTGKLLQYASGYMYDDNRKVHRLHTYKIEEMKQLVAEQPNTPLLVAYWFKPSLAHLRETFPKAVVMDKDGKCVDEWNAGKIPMLLVHPASVAHGLNMQLGPGHTLVYYDTPASLELYLQTNKRIDRPGQKKPVKIIHLVTQGTIEAKAVSKLMDKQSLQDALVGLLRSMRRKLLQEKVDNGG